MFPNLKTLRGYVERTGEPVGKFRFDMQIGKKPTERSKARIYTEAHHLDELYARLDYEESVFSADVRGESRPVDEYSRKSKSQEKTRKQRTKGIEDQPALFEDGRVPNDHLSKFDNGYEPYGQD